MPMATIQQVGQGNLYHIHFLDQTGHPDQGLPGMGGRPDQGLPGGQRPPHVGGQPLPPHVGNRPPGSSAIPDHELPDTPPPNLAAGWTLVLIRHDGKWSYAAIAPGSPPPRPLPPFGGGGHPDQGLPGQPVRPDQGLPGGNQPPLPNQGLPGQPAPPVAGQGPGMPSNPIAPGGQPAPQRR